MEAAERNTQAAAAEAALEQIAKEAKEADRQSNIDACLTGAQTTYENNWNGSCKTLGELSERCEIILLESNPYDKYLSWHPELQDKDLFDKLSTFEKAKDDCSCSLPAKTAERWDTLHKDAEKACYDRY